MTSQFAFIIGSALGCLIGCIVGVFIYYTVKFRSVRRAWCRTAHRHFGYWTSFGGYHQGRHCNECGRDWHRSN